MLRNTRILLHLTAEFGPLLTFFFLAEPLGFIPAVAVFVTLTVVAVVTDFVIRRRFAVFPVVVAVFIVSFGGATLLSGDARFIELNYTVYPLVFGAAALLDILVLRNRLFRWMFGSVFAITGRGWFLTTRNWVYMFGAMALANEVARQSLSPEHWVLFRIVMTAFVLIFSGYQFTVARRERLPEATEWGLRVL